jgi:hypothetical protein
MCAKLRSSSQIAWSLFVLMGAGPTSYANLLTQTSFKVDEYASLGV